MGYFDNLPQKDYRPAMDASRFASAGPGPLMSGGFTEPQGLFKETPGTFMEPKGMFMTDGSKAQAKAIALGLKRDLPTALNPQTPPVKSALAPLEMGQPDFTKKYGWIGGDMSLSPFLGGFAVDRLRGGGMV